MTSALSHTKALEIVRQEFQKIWNRAASDTEALYILSVGWLETHYGRTGQFAALADQGLYNWANIEKYLPASGCPAGWVAGKDHDAQGNLIDVCFKVYQSDNEAANALISTLTKRHWPVLQAIASDSSPESVAHAMKAAPAYYVAPEAQYANGLKNAIAAIRKELGPLFGNIATELPKQQPAAKSSIAAPVVFSSIALTAAYYYFKKR